ncbi:BrnT family toxin [soil metagenome]
MAIFGDDFDWNEVNIGHVSRHGVEPWEVEEGVRDPERIGVSARKTLAERRFAVVGATESGRVLFVVFTRRGEIVRVITARDADDGEKRRYRRR